MADSLRSMNRAPFVLGLLGLTSAAFSIAALVLGGWSWGLALMGLVALAGGTGLIVLYYRLREDEPPS
jgi:Flp pilus assembly protein TadB